jgi:hypothetical protein
MVPVRPKPGPITASDMDYFPRDTARWAPDSTHRLRSGRLRLANSFHDATRRPSARFDFAPGRGGGSCHRFCRISKQRRHRRAEAEYRSGRARERFPTARRAVGRGG